MGRLLNYFCSCDCCRCDYCRIFDKNVAEMLFFAEHSAVQSRMISYKLKHGHLLDTFIEEATQKRPREHRMCIKQKQNISSQSFLRKPFDSRHILNLYGYIQMRTVYFASFFPPYRKDEQKRKNGGPWTGTSW